MNVKGIIFDKDGTLFDLTATWIAPYRMLLDRLVPEVEHSSAADAIGIDFDAGRFAPGSIAIAGTSLEIAQVLANHTGRTPFEIAGIMNDIAAGAPQVPAVALEQVLPALQRLAPLGLVTNDAEASARQHLTGAGVLDCFDFIAGYDSGFGAKPAPGQLLGFADAVGVAPHETLMVGDSSHDLLAAKAAGMVPVAVLTGAAGEADLAPLAETVLPDIGHLETWINAQG